MPSIPCRRLRWMLVACCTGAFAPLCIAQPANDACTNAAALPINPGGSGAVAGDNRTATNDLGLPGCTLGTSASSGTKGVWYTFTGTGNVVTLSTCGTARDLVLRVFCGTDCSSFICAAADDDGCDGPTSSSPRLSVCTVANATYTVLLSRYGGTTGTGIEYLLNWSDSGAACPASSAPRCDSLPAANDDCPSAVAISIGSTTVGTTIDATGELGVFSTCDLGLGQGVWYSFLGNGGNVVASTCSGLTGSNTRVFMFSGPDCQELTCVSGRTTAAPLCAQRADSASTAATCTVAGQRYWVLVSSDSNGSGLFALTLTSSPCEPPPANDFCQNALPLAPGTSTTVDATWATDDTAVGVSSGVWYTYTPPTTQRVEFSTCSGATNFDTRIELFYGECGTNGDALIFVDSNFDTDPACPLLATSATLTPCLLAGRTYYIVVAADFSAASGVAGVSAAALGPCAPANDACSGAQTLNPGVTVQNVSNDAGDETGLSACAGVDVPVWNNGLWFAYTHAGSGPQRFLVTTCGTDPDAPTSFDTALYVFTGSCAVPVCVDANDNASPACGDREDESSVEFCAQPGQTYYVLLANGPTAFDGGFFNLTLSAVTGSCAVGASGACCQGAICSVIAQAGCAGPNSRFAGNGTVCNPAGNNTSPCCKADFNQDQSRNIDDIFIFLNAWFANSPACDIDGDGVNIDDIFVFLNVWFAGC